MIRQDNMTGLFQKNGPNNGSLRPLRGSRARHWAFSPHRYKNVWVYSPTMNT
jgi:hypothetical protein